ncbi:MAG TPA: glycosyltransferase family 4 protein [Candidatus Binatia bacterium]|nr:glycosyltransferase family 4 protein [Candidatus Binatia bacterium]
MSKRFLIWYWSPSGGGGSQYAVKLAQRLARRFGDDAITLSLHADDPSLALASANAFETLAANVVTARRQPLGTVAGLGASARVLADHGSRADCVIVPMNFAAAAPLAMGLQKPLVYVAHDPKPHPGDYAQVLQRATQAALLRKSTRILALSNYAARELARSADTRSKLEVAPLSSVFEPYEVSPRAVGPVLLLFAGRMIAYKGIEILAEALARLAKRDDWRLTIAGAGPALDAAAARRFELSQVERVTRGWLSETELDALVADCDILLAPYRSATQSGVVAQALAHGKPCVVTPVGALGEQIGEGLGGWMAERADAPAFAAALERALSSVDALRERQAGALAIARAAWQHDYWRWLEEI